MDETPRPKDASRRAFLRTTGSIGAVAAVGSSITGFTDSAGSTGGERIRTGPRIGGLDWEAEIPEIRGYPTLGELHRSIEGVRREHPRRTKLRTVGRSRGGREILLLSVGEGRNNALVLGGPHPNEPTGFLTVLHLARLAAEHPELAEGLDVTWHIVPCMDPDAMRLGEGWYGGPHTIENYYGKFYRPAFRNQVEWNFPVEGGFNSPLPETRHLMAVIDELKPKLVYTLHSSDFTGFHFMMNRDVPELVSGVERAIARRGLPFHAAPTDGGATPLGPGAYLLLPRVEPVPGEQMTPGASSIQYAERHGALGILPETAMWHSPAFEDTRGSGHRLPELLGRAADGLERDGEMLADTVRRTSDRFPALSPHFAAVTEGRELIGRFTRAYRRSATDPAQDREATVAERFDLLWMGHTLTLRPAGMLLQLLDGIDLDGIGDDAPDVRRARKRLRQWFVRRCSHMRRDFPGRHLDPRDLTALQLDVAFTAARSL